MTDRELLELAAKAEGGNFEWGNGYCSHRLYRVTQRENSALCTYDEWNPIEDDGDALRLAVKLGATVYTSIVSCHIWATDDKEVSATAEPTGYRYAATRRAIVRAAAEIGKGAK